MCVVLEIELCEGKGLGIDSDSSFTTLFYVKPHPLNRSLLS